MDVQNGPSFWPMPLAPTGAACPVPDQSHEIQSLPTGQHFSTHITTRNPAVESSDAVTSPRIMRKRKGDAQPDNERLSKRLSLLNLEQNGQKLYVPVESPRLQPAASSSLKPLPESDGMQLDSANSKHKVYIYDLDAELSDSAESDDGRLIFIPDIEKHLLQNRIPPAVLANREGQLGGMGIQDMQMVLYSDPASLSVPAEKDSVRKAIIDARARIRRRQKGELEDADDADDEGDGRIGSALSKAGSAPTPSSLREQSGLRNLANHNGVRSSSKATATASTDRPSDAQADPYMDAMELD